MCILRLGPPSFRSRRGARVLGRVNKLPGIDLPADSVEKRRSFSMKVLAEGTALSDFLPIPDWAMSQTERGTKGVLSAATRHRQRCDDG